MIEVQRVNNEDLQSLGKTTKMLEYNRLNAKIISTLFYMTEERIILKNSESGLETEEVELF